MKFILCILLATSTLLSGCSKCSKEVPPPPPVSPAQQAVPDDQGGDGETLPPGDSFGQDLPPDEEMPDQPSEDD